MDLVKTDILKEMERLRKQTASDFAGLGWLDPVIRRVAWRFAIGSISRRTPNMTQRPHLGLMGTAVRSGRLAVFDPASPGAERARQDDPVLLAEGLAAAVFVPIEQAGAITGVLLLGRRTTLDYRSEEHTTMTAAARRLAELADRWNVKLESMLE
jgi:nitrogen regulatory protein A